MNKRTSVSYEEILCVRWAELYGVVNIYTHCFWRGEADRRSWGLLGEEDQMNHYMLIS